MNKYLIGGAILMMTILAACSPAPAASPPATLAPTVGPSVPLAFPEIAFFTNRDGNGEIYVMNEDGSGQTNLTRNPASDTNPAWSPDHTRVAFTSDRDGNNEIYVMNADGSNPTNLTKNAADDHVASWSPDGKQIVFESNRGETAQRQRNLPVINADANSAGSSRAMQIAYRSGPVTSPNQAGTIYVINADGTGQASVLVGYPGGQPSWSPNGKQITFTTNFFGGNGELWVINPDGSGLKRIEKLITAYSWSPDGKQIAFSSWRADLTDSLKNEIYVMNADGSNPVRLTNDGKKDANPTWSPDGKQIVFNSDVGGNQEVYVMNADGSNPTNITHNPGYDTFPAWSSK